MATSTWTSQMEVTVAADVESVIRWWTDAARRLEFRARLERPDVLDFEYQEHIDQGLRIVEIKYIAPMNLRVHYRSAGQMAQGGVAEINAKGNRVLRSEAYSHRVHPSGKEDSRKWIGSGNSSVMCLKQPESECQWSSVEKVLPGGRSTCLLLPSDSIKEKN